MAAVLGIDAAWTIDRPSGVALAVQTDKGWRLRAVAPSYESFYSQGDQISPQVHCNRAAPDAGRLVAAAEVLAGQKVSLVAIDMPLAHTAILGRRNSDNEVSKAYGARKAGTHTPSQSRPGKISDTLRASFSDLGYQLCTKRITDCAVVEVYPHPALIELASAPSRLPYKIEKISKYWPDASPSERRQNVLAQWTRIVALLSREISEMDRLPACPALNAKTSELKSFEDMLDAVVCTWVGICCLENRAKPFGNAESAIWIPATKA